MSTRNWKARLQDVLGAGDKIFDYCSNALTEDTFGKDEKTIDACIRNFQILGDAAKQVPAPIQKELTGVPWQKIKGMRNLLVHEYFGVSPKILWKTIQKDLPDLLIELKRVSKTLDSPAHPWRICPPGESYVRQSSVRSHRREGHPVKDHLRREHCRELESSTKDVLSFSEIEEVAKLFFQTLRARRVRLSLLLEKRGRHLIH